MAYALQHLNKFLLQKKKSYIFLRNDPYPETSKYDFYIIFLCFQIWLAPLEQHNIHKKSKNLFFTCFFLFQNLLLDL